MNSVLIFIVPLIGTSLGALMVYFLKDNISHKLNKLLLGFASGVMIAASIWSLLIPGLELSANLGKLSFIPSVIGFALGIIFMLLIDTYTPHMHVDNSQEGIDTNISNYTKMFLAVLIHNIPEGMAIGVVYIAFMSNVNTVSFASVMAISIGIAIQNFPEGAIVSIPLKSQGYSKNKAFLFGFSSGVVEPISAVLTVIFADFLQPVLPYLLAFAAACMFYVVVEELIPDSQNGLHSNLGTLGAAGGFLLMMVLDVALA